MVMSASALFFFFQAEDGIRDYKVTGVQTCALPIYGIVVGGTTGESATLRDAELRELTQRACAQLGGRVAVIAGAGTSSTADTVERSEERRVGKECRSRWSPYH